MRLFVALDLPTSIRRELVRRYESVSAELPVAKWVSEESIHLTLAFLGELDHTAVSTLDEALQPVFARFPPMTIRIGAVGSFPENRPARVLWAGLESDADMVGLEAAVGEALSGLDLRTRDGEAIYPEDPPPFVPHVTLARARDPWPKWAVKKLDTALEGDALEFDVEAGTLFESELLPTGSRYKPVSRYPLEAEREDADDDAEAEEEAGGDDGSGEDS